MELQKPGSDGGGPLLVARRSGPATPFNASDAMAAVCEMYPGALTTQQRARLGKAAKNLLEGGFDPNIVCAALLTAIRTARVGLAEDFALEIQNAKSGQSLSWREYRRALADLTEEAKLEANPTLRALNDQMKEAFRARG